LELNRTLNLDSGSNVISLRASNGYSKSDAIVEVSSRASSQSLLPDLWILAVGVNEYNSPDLRDLKYAVNDAREMVSFFKAQEGKRFNKVNGLLISDETSIKPTAANVIDNLEFLSQASQNDVVILFLAGHGKKDARNNFFFCTSDTVINDNGVIQRSSAVPGSEIIDVKNLPGKKIVFIDSCHSESVSNTRGVLSDNTDLFMELRDPGTIVFTSCKGNELSQENDNT